MSSARSFALADLRVSAGSLIALLTSAQGYRASIWVVEITLLCAACPCKMDVSRDDLIDTQGVQP